MLRDRAAAQGWVQQPRRKGEPISADAALPLHHQHDRVCLFSQLAPMPHTSYPTGVVQVRSSSDSSVS